MADKTNTWFEQDEWYQVKFMGREGPERIALECIKTDGTRAMLETRNSPNDGPRGGRVWNLGKMELGAVNLYRVSPNKGFIFCLAKKAYRNRLTVLRLSDEQAAEMRLQMVDANKVYESSEDSVQWYIVTAPDEKGECICVQFYSPHYVSIEKAITLGPVPLQLEAPETLQAALDKTRADVAAKAAARAGQVAHVAETVTEIEAPSTGIVEVETAPLETSEPEVDGGPEDIG